jgi:hypothetical protein
LQVVQNFHSFISVEPCAECFNHFQFDATPRVKKEGSIKMLSVVGRSKSNATDSETGLVMTKRGGLLELSQTPAAVVAIRLWRNSIPFFFGNLRKCLF